MRQRASHSVTVPLAELGRNSHTRIGPYTVIAPLARGGMASVVLAEHADTGERVALKVLHPSYAGQLELVDRLFAERDVSNAVSHPALLEVRHAATTQTGLPYLVMELLDGENLGALVDRGRLAVDAIVAIAAQVASALAALHRASYVHCDIKPDNIFVLYDNDLHGWPRAKVIDYGIVTSTSWVPPAGANIAGTPAYMAPEQWRGRPVPKSDVYALGCLLYELLVGDPPYQGTLPELMLAHSEAIAEPVCEQRSDVPPALDALITHLLTKAPALRPTAAETERTLQRILRSFAGDPVAAVA